MWHFGDFCVSLAHLLLWCLVLLCWYCSHEIACKEPLKNNLFHSEWDAESSISQSAAYRGQTCHFITECLISQIIVFHLGMIAVQILQSGAKSGEISVFPSLSLSAFSGNCQTASFEAKATLFGKLSEMSIDGPWRKEKLKEETCVI